MSEWEFYTMLRCPDCGMTFNPDHHQERFIKHMKEKHDYDFPEKPINELCQPFIYKHPVPKDEQEWNKGNYNAEQWLKGKTWEYKTNHPMFNYLNGGICEIMIKHGPDGHTDGNDLITSWILENFTVSQSSTPTTRKT